MPYVVFSRPFRFSPNGYEVIQYQAGPEPVEVPARCAEVAKLAGVLAEPEREGEAEEAAPRRKARRQG